MLPLLKVELDLTCWSVCSKGLRAQSLLRTVELLPMPYNSMVFTSCLHDKLCGSEWLLFLCICGMASLQFCSS